MSSSTRDAIITKALGAAKQSCTFSFQGGEPTLAGIKWFEDFILRVKDKNTASLPVHYSIQTNGYCLNSKWSSFFKRNNFLVGISLDGEEDHHNSNRADIRGKGSFREVFSSIQSLKEAGVNFNILTVVTEQNSYDIKDVFHFYQRQQFRHLQFIPVLLPFDPPPEKVSYSLTPERYGQFLMELFDLWYENLFTSRAISIRFFDNLLGLLKGYPPESCDLQGHCSNQLVIEADGGVYPCDFYVLIDYKMGNINNDSLEELFHNKTSREFINRSMNKSKDCLLCPYFSLCRGGCYRRKDNELKDYYCLSFKTFFYYALPRLEMLSLNI